MAQWESEQLTVVCMDRTCSFSLSEIELLTVEVGDGCSNFSTCFGLPDKKISVGQRTFF